MLPITTLYAAPLVILFVALSANVIRTRRAGRVSLGHADDPLLERRIRAHGNFAEYAPVAIILLGMVEGLGAPDMLLHTIGLLLVAGRVSHAYALSCNNPQMRARVFGMAMTFFALMTSALSGVWFAWPLV